MEEARCCVKKLEDYVSFDVTIDEMFFMLHMVCVIGSFDVYQYVCMVYVPKYPELKFVRMVYVYL
jgi:hypothetical protein